MIGDSIEFGVISNCGGFGCGYVFLRLKDFVIGVYIVVEVGDIG